MEGVMTEGRITPQIFRFSLPIVMGNIFQQLYNTADAMIVGHMLGKNAFASVSVAEPIMSVVLFFFVGLTMGVSVLLSQRFGAGNEQAFRVQYSTALIAGTGFTVAASILCIFLSKAMLYAVQTPAEIIDETNGYLKLIFIGMIFSFLYNYFASSLRAIGDSKAAFRYLVISSIVNICCDVIFIQFTGLGVRGAALATVVAQALSAYLCIRYIYRKIPIMALKKNEFCFEMSVMKDTLIFSWASALQQTFLYFGRLLVQGTINAQGTDMITGYNAAIRLEAFYMAFIDGTGSALSTFAGQNKGAGKKERLKKGLVRTLQMNYVATALFDALALLIPAQLVGIYVSSGNTEMVRIGVTYITAMPVFYFFCSSMSAMQGFFRGVGKVKITMIATMSQIAIRCTMALLLVHRFGIYGVCMSVILGWIWMTGYDGFLCIRYVKRELKEEQG